MRATAIMTVVLAHSSPLLAPLVNVPYTGKAFDLFFKNTFPMALLGVELFFVLSGFLIGGILIKSFVAADTFSFGHVRNFWVRRWFRTLPNYWLILLINLILYKSLGLTRLDKYKLLFFPFLQNLWYPHPLYFFGEAWSLSIEEWFYLTLPVVMWLACRIFSPADKKTFLLKVFSMYLLAFALIRFFNAFHPINGPDQDGGIRKVVVFRLDAVMFGVLIACFNYYSPALLDKLKYRLLAVSAAGTAFVYYLIASPRINICDPAGAGLKFLSDAFLYLCIPLFFCLCLPFANSVKSVGNKYISSAVQHISKISYSMYLVHFSLLFVPLNYFFRITSPGMAAAVYMGYWTVVIGLSSVIYRYFELPVMKLRDKTSKG